MLTVVQSMVARTTGWGSQLQCAGWRRALNVARFAIGGCTDDRYVSAVTIRTLKGGCRLTHSSNDIGVTTFSQRQGR
jgi:hypothetical protein